MTKPRIPSPADLAKVKRMRETYGGKSDTEILAIAAEQRAERQAMLAEVEQHRQAAADAAARLGVVLSAAAQTMAEDHHLEARDIAAALRLPVAEVEKLLSPPS